MKKSKLRKIIPVIMSAALALNPVGAGTASAAKKPALNKKNLEITVGQKTTLKVKNKIKGASYKWTSSKSKVAKVSKKGVVQGLKSGKATITCKVKAKKSQATKARTYNLKCKVTVTKKSVTKPTTQPVVEPTTQPSFETDATPAASPVTKPEATPAASSEPSISTSEITVATQKDLETALKTTGIHSLTLKTDAAETFIIPKGNYADTELTVDAPNADIDNSGIFKFITINAIKSDTFYEKANGNSYNINSPKARVVVNENASVKNIMIKNNSKIELKIGTGGSIGNIKISAKTDILILGDSHLTNPVNVEFSSNAANSIVNTSVKLNITVMAKIKMIFEKGAENSTINVFGNSSVNPDIQNNTGSTINITNTNGETETIGGETGNTISPSYYPPFVLPNTKPTSSPSATLIPDKPAEDINLPLENGWTASWNSSKIVSETAFSQYSADFLAGKKISITYTVDEGGWTNLGVFAGNNEYSDEGNFITIKPTGSTDSTTDYSFDITEEIAEKLISGGLYIAADHAIINSVKIIVKDSTTETTKPTEKPEDDIILPLENGWKADWNSAKIVNENAFSQYSADFLAGKKISIAYTVDEGGWTNLGVFAGNNEYSGEGNFITIKPTGGTDSTTGYSFDITKEIAEKLISGGLYVAADKAVINSVIITNKDTLPEPGNTPKPSTSPEPSVSPEPGTSPEPSVSPEPGTSPEPDASPEPDTSPEPGTSPEPSTPPEDINLPLETGWKADWNSAKIVSETTFSQYSVDFLAGKKMSISYTISEGDWTNLGVFAGSNEYSEGNFITIKPTGNTDSKTGYTFDITEEIAKKLISGGLYVAADKAVIDSIIISNNTLTEPDNPSEDINLSLETGWKADWNSAKIVSETTFSQYSVDFLAGKKMSISYTISEGDWTNLGVFAGSNEYSEGNFITIKPTGNTDSKTGYTFDITEEIAKKLISGGLYVAADKAVIDSVVISSSGI